MKTDPKYPSIMSFITPMVGIGDRGAALDHELIRAKKIEAVLSLAPADLHGVVAHHLHVDVVDRLPLPFQAIATVVAFITGHVKEGRRVFMHCEMGISRSPSLAVCYLHESRGMTIDEALAHVKSIRPAADPHSALLRSIRAYYREGLSASAPKADMGSRSTPGRGQAPTG